ncbi:metallophosphoesterase [Mangrovibacterium lignilyticum]|uniref:metallophosphoesterase n=1 Tax=Mangrovibacterium lignilyticum TaxID=2668052 RepID=UPI0013D74B1E|nr:metallophosphoesterase [Mangrovibacterium lignilyticum]
MSFKQKKMVRWFSVTQLAATGLKSVVSGLFGNFADKREMQAALDMRTGKTGKNYHDKSNHDEIWFDYVSDLGDGFDSTYTLAHLLAKESLELEDERLPRGEFLVMGGDQVYPTPEMEEYDNRLRGPYSAAFPKDEESDNRPSLFAIPGNHDWYDGLSNFIKLFCQERSLGNWKTAQKRSYWAIKLPHHVWLLGIDIQLSSDIDYPQLQYFGKLAKEDFQEGDRVVLCTAEPAWVYASLNEKNESFKRLAFFEKQLLEQCRGVEVQVFLTGDFHHFSHYETAAGIGKDKTHFITAGGGGAFLHPTHLLKEELKTHHQVDAQLKSVFPEKRDSARLAWHNLLFPYLNWRMSAFFGLYFLLIVWLLETHYQNTMMLPFTYWIGQLSFAEFYSALYGDILPGLFRFPAALILHLVLFLGLVLFADTENGLKKWNYLAGILHGAAHIEVLYLSTWLVAKLFFGNAEESQSLCWMIFGFALCLFLLGALLSGLVFGIYLLISSLILKSHPDESFSSFRYAGYKNFLRLHLTKEQLTIYPIGIRNVTSDWKKVGTDENPQFKGTEPKIKLIGKPIKIEMKS